MDTQAEVPQGQERIVDIVVGTQSNHSGDSWIQQNAGLVRRPTGSVAYTPNKVY